MKKRTLLALLLCALLALCSCTSEQTIVKKVSEPLALRETEQLRHQDFLSGSGDILDIAPDGQTALVRQNGLSVYKNGQLYPQEISHPIDLQPAPGVCWSANSRYACLMLQDCALVLDTDKRAACEIPPVLTACFNADHVTLYYARETRDGSLFCRRRVMTGDEEQLLKVPDTLHGPMLRTTRSQYLVMGDDRLLCLEQAEAGLAWETRVVADFSASGMRISDFSYRAQTGLCIVSGDTGFGSIAFSVLSPDGRDFVIDQVSCFTPNGESPAVNLPAGALSDLADSAAYPIRLRRVQLSPGGLYLLLWGQHAQGCESTLHLLNLDSGKLSRVDLSALPPGQDWAGIRWCAGKTFLLFTQTGKTAVATVTGWDD